MTIIMIKHTILKGSFLLGGTMRREKKKVIFLWGESGGGGNKLFKSQMASGFKSALGDPRDLKVKVSSQNIAKF